MLYGRKICDRNGGQLLLDATGSYHRDVLRHAGEQAHHMTAPMMRLQDPEKTKVLVVTLAETTPVLEAARRPGRRGSPARAGRPRTHTCLN